MGITGIHAIPMMITYMLQGTLCDTGIPRTFYGENICSVGISNIWINIEIQGHAKWGGIIFKGIFLKF